MAQYLRYSELVVDIELNGSLLNEEMFIGKVRNEQERIDKFVAGKVNCDYYINNNDNNINYYYHY